MLNFDLVIFDADGTLWDYDTGERKALEAALAAFGVPYDESVLQRYRSINSELWRLLEQNVVNSDFVRVERFRKLLSELGIDMHPFDVQRVAADYLERLSAQAVPMKGAEELLRLLSGRVRMAILTNGISAVQRSRFALSGFGRYINDLIISEEVGVAKPDPAVFVHCLNRLGCTRPERALMVGDSIASDIRGGAAAGIVTCWFNPHGAPNLSDITPDYEIRRLSQLPELLGC